MGNKLKGNLYNRKTNLLFNNDEEEIAYLALQFWCKDEIITNKNCKVCGNGLDIKTFEASMPICDSDDPRFGTHYIYKDVDYKYAKCLICGKEYGLVK